MLHGAAPPPWLNVYTWTEKQWQNILLLLLQHAKRKQS